jgi:hypothetical protein
MRAHFLHLIFLLQNRNPILPQKKTLALWNAVVTQAKDSNGLIRFWLGDFPANRDSGGGEGEQSEALLNLIINTLKATQ